MTTRLGVNIQRQTVTPTESQAEPSRSAVVAAADAQIATTPQASTIGAHIDVKNTAAINAEFDNLERASYQILSSAAPVTLASNSVTPSSSASSSSSSRSRYVSRSSSSRSMASIRSPKAPTSKSRAEGNRQETFALPPLLGFPTLAVAASIPEAQATTASLGPGLDSSGSSAVSASGLNAGGRSKTNRSSKTTTTTTSGEDVSYTGGNSGSISGSSNINSGGGGGRSTTSASSPFDEKRVRQDLEKNWQSFYQHMQGPKRRETVGWLYSNGIEIVKRRTCDDSRNPSCGALREGSKNPTVQYVFSSELKPPKKINPKDD